MNPVPFKGQHVVIGESQGYKPLPIRRMLVQGPNGLIATYDSRWKPTEEEIKKLVAGGLVTLTVRSRHNHPPVMLEVE